MMGILPVRGSAWISRRRLEAVEPGHLHVQEDEREVAVADALDGLGSGRGAHDAMAERLEHRFEGEPVGCIVVHDQDGGHRLSGVRPRLHGLASRTHDGAWRALAPARLRTSSRSSPESIGFSMHRFAQSARNARAAVVEAPPVMKTMEGTASGQRRRTSA